MITHQVAMAFATVISSMSLGSVLVALIAWRRFGPRTKAEAGKLAAETRETDADTQGKLLAQIDKLLERVDAQDEKITRLENTIGAQGEQIVALQRKNDTLGATMRAALVELLAWIKKALAVMTPDQQASVGQPPDYQHLVAPAERN